MSQQMRRSCSFTRSSSPSPLEAPPSGNSSKAENIKVYVRIRPLSARERQRGEVVAWDTDGAGGVGPVARNGSVTTRFAYDTVFDAAVANAQVYEAVARPLLPSVLTGTNATVLAYGVTSSGKTHTMMGRDSDSASLPETGLVQRSLQELFAAFQEVQDRTYTITLSMMEVYCEQLNDLLNPSKSNLEVVEVPVKGPGGVSTTNLIIKGLTEVKVNDLDHALSLFKRGQDARKVGATAMNDQSSRSHTLCRFQVSSKPLDSQSTTSTTNSSATATATGRLGSACGSGPTAVTSTSACLTLADLAGSEGAAATTRKDQRLEAANINKSLLTLGKVIWALGRAKGAGAGELGNHIPFRDSLLTRLLKPSLTGSGAHVALVCCVAPGNGHSEETRNTLLFADGAKRIRVAATRQEAVDWMLLVRQLQGELAAAQEQLAALGAGGGVKAAGASGVAVSHADYEQLQLSLALSKDQRSLLQYERDALAHLNQKLLALALVPAPTAAAAAAAAADGEGSASAEPSAASADAAADGEPAAGAVDGGAAAGSGETFPEAAADPLAAANMLDASPEAMLEMSPEMDLDQAAESAADATGGDPPGPKAFYVTISRTSTNNVGMQTLAMQNAVIGSVGMGTLGLQSTAVGSCGWSTLGSTWQLQQPNIPNGSNWRGWGPARSRPLLGGGLRRALSAESISNYAYWLALNTHKAAPSSSTAATPVGGPGSLPQQEGQLAQGRTAVRGLQRELLRLSDESDLGSTMEMPLQLTAHSNPTSSGGAADEQQMEGQDSGYMVAAPFVTMRRSLSLDVTSAAGVSGVLDLGTCDADELLLESALRGSTLEHVMRTPSSSRGNQKYSTSVGPTAVTAATDSSWGLPGLLQLLSQPQQLSQPRSDLCALRAAAAAAEQRAHILQQQVDMQQQLLQQQRAWQQEEDMELRLAVVAADRAMLREELTQVQQQLAAVQQQLVSTQQQLAAVQQPPPQHPQLMSRQSSYNGRNSAGVSPLNSRSCTPELLNTGSEKPPLMRRSPSKQQLLSPGETTTAAAGTFSPGAPDSSSSRRSSFSGSRIPTPAFQSGFTGNASGTISAGRGTLGTTSFDRTGALTSTNNLTPAGEGLSTGTAGALTPRWSLADGTSTFTNTAGAKAQSRIPSPVLMTGGHGTLRPPVGPPRRSSQQ